MLTVYQSIPAQITSKFVGYDRLVHESEISVLTTDTEIDGSPDRWPARNHHRG